MKPTKLPFFVKIIHLFAINDGAQLILTNIGNTPSKLQPSNNETKASKEHESSAVVMETVFFLVRRIREHNFQTHDGYRAGNKWLHF